MLSTTKSLLELTAFDLMSRNVVMIPRQMSLRAAAHLLAQGNVTGAPVIDEQGRCVGVLSATDMVRSLDRGEKPRNRLADAECMCCDWEIAEVDSLPPDAVSRYMTTDVVTAHPDSRIGELARQMMNAHIHRIVIADGAGKPVGIVSTMDILVAVAREDAIVGDTV